MLTPYQSCYAAWELTRRTASDSVESLASTLVDAQVDLNPHQVEAALFACRNPLSRGVLLADEVGNLKDKVTRQRETEFSSLAFIYGEFATIECWAGLNIFGRWQR